ncbi:nucleoside deaminase [Anaerolineales bacterium HSG24]|nr:nucleoside deaminase [Anaerolineales bacterium HSG24]
MSHEKFMRICFELAENAIRLGNEPFGAVLVKDDQILFKAENNVNTDNDCTHHAELNLISRASQQLGANLVAQCWLYTSTEPCAMCSGAIHWAGIQGVVYGCSAEKLDEIFGSQVIIPACIEIFARSTKPLPIIGPILETEAVAIHQRYWPTL